MDVGLEALVGRFPDSCMASGCTYIHNGTTRDRQDGTQTHHRDEDLKTSSTSLMVARKCSMEHRNRTTDKKFKINALINPTTFFLYSDPTEPPCCPTIIKSRLSDIYIIQYEYLSFPDLQRQRRHGRIYREGHCFQYISDCTSHTLKSQWGK